MFLEPRKNILSKIKENVKETKFVVQEISDRDEALKYLYNIDGMNSVAHYLYDSKKLELFIKNYENGVIVIYYEADFKQNNANIHLLKKHGGMFLVKDNCLKLGITDYARLKSNEEMCLSTSPSNEVTRRFMPSIFIRENMFFTNSTHSMLTTYSRYYGDQQVFLQTYENGYNISDSKLLCTCLNGNLEILYEDGEPIYCQHDNKYYDVKEFGFDPNNSEDAMKCYQIIEGEYRGLADIVDKVFSKEDKPKEKCK